MVDPWARFYESSKELNDTLQKVPERENDAIKNQMMRMQLAQGTQEMQDQAATRQAFRASGGDIEKALPAIAATGDVKTYTALATQQKAQQKAQQDQALNAYKIQAQSANVIASADDANIFEVARQEVLKNAQLFGADPTPHLQRLQQMYSSGGSQGLRAEAQKQALTASEKMQEAHRQAQLNMTREGHEIQMRGQDLAQEARLSGGKESITDFATFYRGFKAQNPTLEGGNLDAAANDAWHKLKVEEATSTSKARGMGFAEARMVSVLDTENGNRPVMISAADLSRANDETPDRFVSAARGEKALNKMALLEDMRGVAASTRTSLANVEDFTPQQRAQLALVLKHRDPKSAFDNFMGSQWATSLSEKQIDYVTDLVQLKENAMAMRSVLGAGQGSDEMRAAISATIPGIFTPNKEFANKQLDKFILTLDRLERGVPTVPLKEQRPSANIPVQVTTEQEYKSLPAGTLYQPPDGSATRRKP